jgi:hypothetical protein
VAVTAMKESMIACGVQVCEWVGGWRSCFEGDWGIPSRVFVLALYPWEVPHRPLFEGPVRWVIVFGPRGWHARKSSEKATGRGHTVDDVHYLYTCVHGQRVV